MKFKKHLTRIATVILACIFCSTNVFADLNLGNADGTGFSSGTANNYWGVHTDSGTSLNDTEGLRVTVYDTIASFVMLPEFISNDSGMGIILLKSSVPGLFWNCIFPSISDIFSCGPVNASILVEQLKDHLEYLGMIPDDYFKLSEAESDIIPADWLDFNSIVSFDGSDGIFLDIYLNTSNGTQKFASGKTLNTSTDSFIWLSRIAAECNLMLNGNGCEMFLPQDIEDELRNTDNSEQIQNCERVNGALKISWDFEQSEVLKHEGLIANNAVSFLKQQSENLYELSDKYTIECARKIAESLSQICKYHHLRR